MLHPECQDRAKLAKLKNQLGARDFGAQYQQEPSADEAVYFRRENWKFFTLAPSEMAKNVSEMWQTWDLTFKGLNTSDFVVGGVIGVKGADFFLFDLIRAQMNFTATKSAIRGMSSKWPRAHAKLIEDKANGPAIIDELKRDIGGIIAIEPDADKISRAAAISPYQEAGNLYLPDPKFAPWVSDFIEELAAFPGGAHDDQVDMLSQGVRWYLKKNANEDRVTVF